MFLVEPASGRRCSYRSAGALGEAIRRGELGPQARIFHRTTQRWLPITVHPEYRKVESARQALNSQWRAWEWTFLAERPSHAEVLLAPSGTFRPIPTRSYSDMVLVPEGARRSWLGTLRRLLRIA
jgi:hypothetical protein